MIMNSDFEGVLLKTTPLMAFLCLKCICDFEGVSIVIGYIFDTLLLKTPSLMTFFA